MSSILAIQAVVAIYAGTKDKSGLGAALFVLLMVITLLAWPIVLSIDRQINNRVASQNLKPSTPQQLKLHKIIRILIIGGVLVVIIAALR